MHILDFFYFIRIPFWQSERIKQRMSGKQVIRASFCFIDQINFNERKICGRFDLIVFRKITEGSIQYRSSFRLITSYVQFEVFPVRDRCFFFCSDIFLDTIQNIKGILQIKIKIVMNEQHSLMHMR